MDIERLARPDIVAMKPYVSARSSAAADGILLNANEAPDMHVTESRWRALSLHRYPQPQPADLRSKLAELYAVSEDRLLITRGSDEGIDLLTRVFCRAGKDAVVECSPCFGMYRIAAAIQGARVIDVPRRAGDGFSIDFGKLLQTIDDQPGVRLVFLTSPNNPTGDLVSRERLEAVLRAADGKALVVLDEAYIEFAAAPSASELLTKWPQLVVLRTLSKAWAAAGIRCGIVMADPRVIGLLQRVIAPYPLSVVAVDAALSVISADSRARQQAFVEAVRRRRADFFRFLSGLDWVRQAWQGEANFVLVRVDDAAGLVDWCARHGIRIRDFSTQELLGGCVRMTIGSEREMAGLKSVLQAYGAQS
jgi:histidinol-phosphate aminotransferase